jgi:hypothetical protein
MVDTARRMPLRDEQRALTGRRPIERIAITPRAGGVEW